MNKTKQLRQYPSCLGIAWIGTMIALLVTLLTGLGFLGSFWWGFGLLEHWRGQYCWILLLCGGAIAYTRMKWVLLCLFPFSVNLAVIGLLYWPVSAATADNDALSLRILHFNLDRHNSQPEKVLQYLDNQTVDLLSLQEVTPEWNERLRSRLNHYQLVAAEIRRNSHGSALLIPKNASRRLTIQSTETLHLPQGSERPLLAGKFFVEGQSILLLNLHLTRPRSRATAVFQQRELSAVAQWSHTVQAQGQKVVIVGDFNSTPWTQGFQTLLQQGDLVNSQQGYGWQTTWPAGWPSALRIAIDHCLHSEGITTLSRSTGPALASDHLPLTIELQLDHKIR